MNKLASTDRVNHTINSGKVRIFNVHPVYRYTESGKLTDIIDKYKCMCCDNYTNYDEFLSYRFENSDRYNDLEDSVKKKSLYVCPTCGSIVYIDQFNQFDPRRYEVLGE